MLHLSLSGTVGAIAVLVVILEPGHGTVGRPAVDVVVVEELGMKAQGGHLPSIESLYALHSPQKAQP